MFKKKTVSSTGHDAQSDVESSSKQSESELHRRTELNIYPEIQKQAMVEENKKEITDSLLLDSVRFVRTEGCKVVKIYKIVWDRCTKFINTGIAHSYSNYVTTVDYLREEKHSVARLGAIGGGSLLGYIISFRKNFFKRLLYMSAGGISATYVCYPVETNQYFKQSFHNSKNYALVGYHFLNGVTKDYGGFTLPAFPLKLLNQDIQELKKEPEKNSHCDSDD